MRLIIAGSRSLTNPQDLLDALDASGFQPTVVLSGWAAGVDFLGEQWAHRHGIPVEPYPANWRCHGMAAGPLRNETMAQKGEALLAVWDGKSRGTMDMLRKARKYGLTIVEWIPMRYRDV